MPFSVLRCNDSTQRLSFAQRQRPFYSFTWRQRSLPSREPSFHGAGFHSAIPQIAQAHAQVMMQRVGNADGEAEAEESLGEAERVEVAVAAEQSARNCSPD